MFSVIAILVLLVPPLYHVALASAALVNVTVDDTFGDPATGAQFIYSPQEEWISGSSPKNCSGCLSFIDPAYVHNGTWHNTFYDPTENDTPQSASISFHGSALYVYCVLVYNVSAPGSNPNMSFMVDDQVVGSFNIAPTSDSEDVISYNYLVFAQENLLSQAHTFTLVNWASKGSTSLAILDYIKYSTDSFSPLTDNFGPTSSVNDPPAATITIYLSDLNIQTRAIIIAVSTVGATLLLALGAFVVFWRRYVRANTSSTESYHGPSSVQGEESHRPSPWMEGVWVNQQYSRRPSHKSQLSVERALLPSAREDSMGVPRQNVSASLIIHTVASRREQPKPEEYDPVVSKANSGGPPNSLRGTIIVNEDQNIPMSEHLPRHPAVLRRPLIVTIPGRVSSAEPALPSSSSIPPPPPPKSPGRTLKSALRPRSEPACTSPPSAGSSRMRSIPGRTTTSSTGTRGSTGFGGDRTTTNSMSTPTSLIPMDFCFQSPSVRYLPAREDSVKTIKLSPNRHPDMPEALRSARTVPLEGASSHIGSHTVGDDQRRRSDMQSAGQQKDLPPLLDQTAPDDGSSYSQ